VKFVSFYFCGVFASFACIFNMCYAYVMYICVLCVLCVCGNCVSCVCV